MIIYHIYVMARTRYSKEQNNLYLLNIDQDAQSYKKKKSRPFTNVINQHLKLLHLKTQHAEPKALRKIKNGQLRDEL